MLKALGASVTERKCEDLAWIESRGYIPLHTNNIAEYIGSYDIIFNTVPSVILDRQILSFVSKDALIIDLSSKPGGEDFYLNKIEILLRRKYRKFEKRLYVKRILMLL